MDTLEKYYRKQFDQPTGPILDQIKFILRIWQSQGHSKQALPFLLLLESMLEKEDREEPIRTKLLRLLQPETEEINREKPMNEHGPEIDITASDHTGIYTLFAHSSKYPTETNAQGLLDIATWVEQHRNQLRKEAGQEIIPYHVKLYASRVRPLGSSVPELFVEAINAQEAAGRALLHYGARHMKMVVVISAAKEETFDDVELQQDLSITFSGSYENLLPQPPLEPPVAPEKQGNANQD